MNDKERRIPYGTIVFIVACAVLVWMIANYRHGLMLPGGPLYVADYTEITGHAGPLTEPQRWAMAIADGSMVIGAVVLGVGILTWISTTGLFDTLGYGASVLLDRILFRNRGTRFYDYKMAKEEARKQKKPARMLLIVGGVLLAICVIATSAFYAL